MKRKYSDMDSFDENQSIQIIREMIQVSQNKIRKDGILFILWGWIMFASYALMFLTEKVYFTTFWSEKLLDYLIAGLVVSGLVYTAYYLYQQRKKVQTYIGISLRYVWGSLFIATVLINLIQFNVLHEIIFELQHPIFMVVTAFAIVVTGGILRYRLIATGGVIFGLMAYISSFLPLPEQLLIESVSWVIAFILPGHILYSKRNS
jgi:hypothetical protein